jgi:MoxR-like ATPase
MDPTVIREVLPGFQCTGVRRSVVLIDEVDKAPRDFPNDILYEVEDLSFQIPELG